MGFQRLPRGPHDSLKRYNQTRLLPPVPRADTKLLAPLLCHHILKLCCWFIGGTMNQFNSVRFVGYLE